MSYSQGKPRRQYPITCLLLLPLLMIPHLLRATSTVEIERTDGDLSRFCNGSLADCTVLSTEELLLDPWGSKATTGKKLSYAALKQNQPVCRATAYSNNCIPPKSNDYTKPCAKIYRCKS